MKSVLRWAGSKRSVAEAIRNSLGTRQVHTFWEPFGGSLSVTLAVLSSPILKPSRIVVADVNKDLVAFYKTVRDRFDAFLAACETMQDDYYANRDAFNTGEASDDATRAALFYYLNATSFNGLFRRNASGRYNVPWGKRVFRFDPDQLRAFSQALAGMEIHAMSYDAFFDRFLGEMLPGDVLYADPPYHGTFAGYDSRVYTEDDQVRLRIACDRARERGVHVAVSNSDTPMVREVWRDYRIDPFDNARLFNPHGKDRAKRPREVLIVST